ncbi:xanthine dehydrogenase family protein molybdopterin-binding subunit [Curtobacterium sp. MCBD17_019]|uniref:xanthine dehydrogenase family protein molybdopterin-binding subunit n=1 Tax=Curtobacterium sp. MCBD17_019 TaxID=2175669 RepID=UPI000DA9720A|nr:xanthine dehydrogenase family protein molybdopterin-binding subunit [Curtobacterium sp. MCBD17_019]PZE76647.1 xanthine dehydrogenase family protein molybdopterin-binding subunit [Curtobacterium sp. MCBD17_019]
MTAIGAPLARLEGREKTTGIARYAFEQGPEDDVLYAWPVQASVVTGRIVATNADEVRAMPGVVTVLTHEDAPRLQESDDAELLVLQSDRIAYRGQVVALVVAETLETAREAAARFVPEYAEEGMDVVLTEDHPKLYAPEQVNAGFATDSSEGDVDAALATAATSIDATYRTPALFNNPMEPHATTAHWHDGRLDVVDASQGTSPDQSTIVALFGLDPSSVRVRAEHVGGGFGSKGSPRPNVPLAVMAAMVTGRPVKIAYTRQMMFAIAGYRTPTISRMRLGLDTDGHLTAVSHQAYSHTSSIQEFAEQTGEVTRHMYGAPNMLVTHRLAGLDVPTPRWMRAPGECPGMYALESAMDELAIAAGIDPVELRVRNDPEVDPESGQPFSSRNLVVCLRRGAELFGWDGRDPRPGVRREGRWLVGTGVAASSYPAMAQQSGARATALPGGRYAIGVNATDIGTGARTVMAQIAADALEVPVEAIDISIADSDLPVASVAGGSSGTASWGWAVTKACRHLTALLDEGQPVPPEGLEVVVDTTEDVAAMGPYVRQAFGAQFVEARVDLDSGEVVVPRMVGVFAAGRIMNPRTARSQFVGGMTMGLSMALHEHGLLDPVLGDYGNHDLATYHVAANADVEDLHVEWLDERDDHLAPMGGKGIGEIGIVGAAAAVTNAVWHATGVRIRSLPVQPDKLVGALPSRA